MSPLDPCVTMGSVVGALLHLLQRRPSCLEACKLQIEKALLLQTQRCGSMVKQAIILLLFI